jgi:hypothetical protein
MGWNCRSVLSVATLLYFDTATSWAYPTPVDFDGRVLRWNITAESTPIGFVVEGEDPVIVEEFRPVIEEAAGLWNDVETSYIRLARVTNGQTPQIRINLSSTIAGGEHSAGWSLMSKDTNGNPSLCEIHVAVDDTTAYVPFAKTALHELGHCVGLGHSLIPEAIMSYSLAKNSFALDIDDEAAVTRLYPVDADSPKLPPGCAVGTGTGNAPAPWMILGLVLLPLLITVLRLVSSDQLEARCAEKRHDSGSSARKNRSHA